MLETKRNDPGPVIGFPVLGCLGAGAILAVVGPVIAFYLTYAYLLAQILIGIAGLAVGGIVRARGGPRLQRAFSLGTVAMIAATVTISLNHNGPDPVMYLIGDAIGVSVGVAAAWLVPQPVPWRHPARYRLSPKVLLGTATMVAVWSLIDTLLVSRPIFDRMLGWTLALVLIILCVGRWRAARLAS